MAGTEPRGEAFPKRRRRWVRWTAAVVVLAVAAFFAGGGWHFSSEIRSDALYVEPAGPPDYEVRVIGAGEGSLTLVLPSDPAPDLVSDEILGVAWEGGYGQVGVVMERAEGRITRAYTPITGIPGPGTMVALQGDAFPEDPRAALGLAFQAVSYRGPIGDYPAWYIEGEGSTWAIFVHGRGAGLGEALRALPVFVEAGHPCLVISYRNDAGAPAVEGRLARFGATEWEDLEGAVRYAIDNGAGQVVLVGFSMGGAIVAAFLLESDLARQVEGVVLEAPALELGTMVDARAGETDLPLIPIRIPMMLTATSKLLASWRFGVDWGEIDYLARADEFTTPMLVIHGTDDDTVPFEIGRALAEARPDLVTLVPFQGAGHVRAWNVDPDRYRSALEEFLGGIEG